MFCLIFYPGPDEMLFLNNEKLPGSVSPAQRGAQIYFRFLSHVVNPVCVLRLCLPCRSEAPPAEHRLWQLPGERGFSPHCVRHRRQAEGEDGGGVSPHEEPVLRAAGQLHGLHHVCQKLYC